MWEDPAFKDGGRIVFRAQKGRFSNLYWERLLFSLVGENFEDEDQVLGLVLQIKPKFNAIGIWIRDAKDPQKVQTLKQDLTKIMELQPDHSIDVEIFHQEEEEKPKKEESKFQGMSLE